MATKPHTKSECSQGVGLRERTFLGIVLLVVALTYAATLRFGFVYDDGPQIVHNPFIRAWHYVPQYFVSSVWKQLFPFVPGNYYRPLFLLWLRLNYAIFGVNEIGWHLTTVLLHVLVTWLVYRLVIKLTGRFTLAWLTALIFGIHPIHHEVVAWASGTTESLFAVVFLAAFLMYLNSKERSRILWMTLSCIAYALALLCKETAIVLPALVFAHEWIASGSKSPMERPVLTRRLGLALTSIAFYVPIAAVYLFVRSRILSGLGHATSNVSVYTWLVSLPSIFVFYMKHWVFPLHLAEFYDLFYQSKVGFMGVILPILVLAVVALAVWRLGKRFGSRITYEAVAWIVIPLLPALNTFVFQKGELVHDRYFYVPSIGAALLTGLIIEQALTALHDSYGKSFLGQQVFGQPTRVVGAALALAAVLGVCAGRETSFWMDDYTLYSRAHQIAPLNPTALNNLGAELMGRHQIESAQELLETGYQQYPGDSRLAFNLGRLNYMKKDYVQSEDYTKKAIQLDPTAADTFILLGQIQLQEGKSQAAIQTIHHAVELNPYDPAYHTSYGIVLEMSGNCAAAIPQFESALALNSGDFLTQREILRCRTSLHPVKNSGPVNKSATNPNSKN